MTNQGIRDNNRSEGEVLIASKLKHLGIKFREQEEIRNLKYDKKSYRIADFYLPEYNVYIEFLGQWNDPKEKERYRFKKEVYYKNKIPCLYFYPENIGAFEDHFDLRLQDLFKEFNMQKELNGYNSQKIKKSKIIFPEQDSIKSVERKSTSGISILIFAGVIIISLVAFFVYTRNENTRAIEQERLLAKQLNLESSNLNEFKKKQNEEILLQQKALEKEKIKNNITNLVTIKPNFETMILGGIVNLHVTLENRTDYLLDSVNVEVNYITSDNEVYLVDTLNYHLVSANSKRTLEAPDCERGTSVRCEILHLRSKSLDLNF